MSAGPLQPSQNFLELVSSRINGVLHMLTSPQESGINHALIRRRGQQQQQQAEAGPSNASTSGNQDPVNEEEQAEGPSAPPGDVCFQITRSSCPSLTSELRLLPTLITLTARVKLRREGSVRRQKLVWRSRKRPQRREQRNVTTMTTTTSATMMGMSIPPHQSRSGQASQAAPSRPMEVSRNVPNARNSSPWCAFSAALSLAPCLWLSKTNYTMAADPPPGYLCHSCAKASGADPFKKAPVLRKRKPAAERRNVINHQEIKFPTLVSLCVKVRVTVRWWLCPSKPTTLSVR
jgi:hypothetical protein